MKSGQWVVAVLILGAMVFALTFAMNYLGGLNESKPAIVDKGSSGQVISEDDGVGQELTFPSKIFPKDGQTLFENEFKSGGKHDYWFVFEGNRPLKIGLDSKNCTCTSVQLFMPDQALVAKLGHRTADGKLDMVAFEKATEDPKIQKEFESSSKMVALDQNEQPIIKPGEIGWIRLKWKTEKIGPQRLAATIWFGKIKTGAEARLEVGINVFPALLVDQSEQSVDVLSPLVPQKNLVFKCFSATRKNMEIIARMSRPRPDETITIGAPTALTADELLAEEKKLKGPAFLCGYKIPVSVSYNVPGGKDLMELGPFTRQIEFMILSQDKKEPEIDTKAEARISGKVEGEFRVLDADQKGRMTFGVFPRSLGAKKEIKIETDLTGIELELDLKKTSEFLKVKPMSGWPQDQPGRRTWKYQVEISGGTVSGQFPRDDEFYRDSAIYLKSKGPNSRSIRVPVEGRSDN